MQAASPSVTQVALQRTTETLENFGDIERIQFSNVDVTVKGKVNLHLTSLESPLENASVNLVGDDAWLYLDYATPSVVLEKYLSSITIDGKAAVNKTNCRVAIWANGTVVIPNGPSYDSKALVAYDGENFSGKSKEFKVDTYHSSLGTWDNKIRSFKLRKGYMATLANNSNGTGFSKVFIADDADLEIPVMPEGMEGFVSFIRVFRWNWVSKKGKAGEADGYDKLNLTAYYNWSANNKYKDNSNLEFTPIKQQPNWPSEGDIRSMKNVTHLLGYNEPDRPDQANVSLDKTIQNWPSMFKSGLRLGSPAPSTITGQWVKKFFATIDSLNYRVDIAVAHSYENSLNATSLVNRINQLSSQGNGRPVWITEWNNGANWTGESWPTASGEKRDANSNIIYDENGNTTTVSRPLTKENAAKQRAFMEQVLPALDKANKIERYYEYDWVQDCRALLINGELTPAGKVYAEHKAALAYNKASAYDTKWKIAPPFPLLSINKEQTEVTLRFYDHNGETGKKYIIERRADGEKSFSTYKEVFLDKDYKAGETLSLVFPTTDFKTTVRYRIKALSYKDTESIYSRIVTCEKDPEAVAPDLKAEALSSSIVKLTWEAIEGAKSYTIERSDKEGEGYVTVASDIDGTEFIDKDLNDNATYYYRAYTLTSVQTSPASAVAKVSTLKLTIPDAVSGLHASASTGKAWLRWNFAYDALYRVYRSTSINADFKLLAENLEQPSYMDENLVNGMTYYYKVQPYNKMGTGEESSIVSVVPEAGKVLHLSFDEQEGTIAYDQWKNWDASLVNGASFVEGRNGGCAVKITRSDKSYVEIPQGVVSELGDFTISTWIQFNGAKNRIFDFGSGTKSFMMLGLSNSGLRYKITCSKGTFDHTFATSSWTSNKWYHIVLTQKDDVVTCYLDGESLGSETSKTKVLPSDLGTTTQNWLGRSQWASDSYVDNVYDDFRIYDVALSDEQVESLFMDQDVSPSPQYAREVVQGNWNTVCLPYSATPSQGVKCYEIAGVNADKTKLYLTPVVSLVAGVPYVFCSENSVAVFPMSGNRVEAPVTATCGLVGSFDDNQKVEENTYVLQSNAWYLADSSYRTERFTASLKGVDELPELVLPTQNYMTISYGTTGIHGIQTSTDVNEPIYNLSGMKVKKQGSGIYIVKNKKYVVR